MGPPDVRDHGVLSVVEAIGASAMLAVVGALSVAVVLAEMVSVHALLVLAKDDSVTPDEVAKSADLFPVNHPQMTLEAGHRGADEVAELTPEPAPLLTGDVENQSITCSPTIDLIAIMIVNNSARDLWWG